MVVNEYKALKQSADPTRKFRDLYARDILGYYRDVLKVTLTADEGSDQIAIVEAVQRAAHKEGPRFVAVSSGTGTGKTRYIAAGVALWYLTCFKDAQVITTSSSWDQVENQLWTKMRALISDSDDSLKDVFEKINDTKLVMKGNPDSYAVGKSSKKPDNIRGFHAPNLLFIYDEMSGIDEKVLESSLGALTTNAVALKISNPTKETGAFYNSFHKDKELNACFFLDAECSQHVSKEWLHERRVEWGEDSMMYKVFVKGQFPGRSVDQLIPVSWVVDAKDKCLDEENELFRKFKPTLKVLSIDVATMGDDFTVFTKLEIDELHDLAIEREQITEAKFDPTEITNMAKFYIGEFQPDVTVVDAIGNGEGVCSNLKHAGYNVIGFKGSYSPTEKQSHYYNLKSEGYHKMADRFRKGTVSIRKQSGRLMGELPQIRFKIDPTKNRVLIVDPTKSPDHSDSLMMGLMAPVLQGQGRIKSTDMSDVFRALNGGSPGFDIFGGFGSGGVI